MTDYINVWGERVSHDDATLWYVCGHCGAELDSYEYNALRCRGPEHHVVTDRHGLQNRPEAPRECTSTGTLTIGAGTLPYSVVVIDYKCARCGARLEIDGGKLYCKGLPSHAIKKGEDVAYRHTTRPIQEMLDYYRFVEDWNQLSGGKAMPIKDRKPRATGLSRAGIIRLGFKVPVIDKKTGKQKIKNGKPVTRPADVNYFVLKDAPTVAEAYAGHKEKSDQYGSGPAELLVYLPFGDPAMNFDAHYEVWGAGGCYCRGDGAIVKRAWNEKGVDLLVDDGWVVQAGYSAEFDMELRPGGQVTCSGSGRPIYERCKDCRLSGVLRVMIRNPKDPTQLVGDDLRYYQIRTHSGVTYDRLWQQVQQYQRMAQQFGTGLPGIPFRLLRVPEKMSYVAEDWKTGERYRAQSDHALMSLEPDEAWVAVMTSMMHASAVSLDTGASTPALPAGDDRFVAEEGLDDSDGYDHEWKYEDLEEGEFEDAEPDENGKAGTEPPTGKKEEVEPPSLVDLLKSTDRPWPADLVCQALQYRAEKKAEEGITGELDDDARKALTDKLDDLLDGEVQHRLAFLKQVFGVEMSTQLTAAQCAALSDWLKGKGKTDELVKEARAVVGAALGESGEEAGEIDDFLGPKQPVREKFGGEGGDGQGEPESVEQGALL